MDGTAGSRRIYAVQAVSVRRLVDRGMGVYEARHGARSGSWRLMSETLSSDPVFPHAYAARATPRGACRTASCRCGFGGRRAARGPPDQRRGSGRDAGPGPLAPQTIAIVRQIGSAFDAAHAAGATHRDVKRRTFLVGADDFAYLVIPGCSAAVENLTSSAQRGGHPLLHGAKRFSESHTQHPRRHLCVDLRGGMSA